MKFLQYILVTLAVIILTVLTQIGGVIYLITLICRRTVTKKINNRFARFSITISVFLVLYTIATLLFVPILAKPFGRVPLPITQNGGLKPLNLATCFLNRHYVRRDMREAALETAKQMRAKFPEAYVNYLDANFPFFNGFPLFPHLSHNDGKKLDVAFLYINNQTENAAADAPSPIGYGISETPASYERDISLYCEKKGYWQYSMLSKVIPQKAKINYRLDHIRTKALINILASNPSINKIFLEPHLKARLGLTSNKIRFHGCQAVRHDDHIHIQLK